MRHICDIWNVNKSGAVWTELAKLNYALFFLLLLGTFSLFESFGFLLYLRLQNGTGRQAVLGSLIRPFLDWTVSYYWRQYGKLLKHHQRIWFDKERLHFRTYHPWGRQRWTGSFGNASVIYFHHKIQKSCWSWIRNIIKIDENIPWALSQYSEYVRDQELHQPHPKYKLELVWVITWPKSNSMQLETVDHQITLINYLSIHCQNQPKTEKMK